MPEITNQLYSIEYGGELRMGAAVYIFVLRKAIKGLKRLQTVNGQALAASDGSCLVIFDRIALLVLDYKTAAVHHFHAEKGETLYEVKFQPDGGLSLRLDTPGGKRLLQFNWQTKQGLSAGFGPVSGGCFPSATALRS
ncbi:MAG: hypothetical protein KKI09_06600 [Spirochaetes bacterium]|nr:hypothetical protein [Spirochaetota bacterium]